MKTGERGSTVEGKGDQGGVQQVKSYNYWNFWN